MYAGQDPVGLTGLLEVLEEDEAPFQLLHVPVLEIVTVFVMVEVLVVVEQTGPAPYVTVEQVEVTGYPAVSMW